MLEGYFSIVANCNTMERKLSEKLSDVLLEVEIEIKTFLRENKFYLEFKRKDYAACEQGQALQEMTMIAVNLGHQIQALKKYGL